MRATRPSSLLRSTGRPTVLADNVLPQIGVIAPESARAAIRAAFLRHVIGGKGLSRDPAFAAMVAAATPDVVLRGVEVLAAESGGGDVLVVDIGGATTDVYSCLTPEGEDATLRKDVVAPLWHARTVEGDLGMRWNAEHIVEAAEAEQLIDASPVTETLRAYAVRVHERPGSLPVDDSERALDLELARLAALVAVRRHARPAQPTESPRPLANVTALHRVGRRAAPHRRGRSPPGARRRAGRPRRWLEGAARREREGRHGIPALCGGPARRPRARGGPRRRGPGPRLTSTSRPSAPRGSAALDREGQVECQLLDAETGRHPEREPARSGAATQPV